MTREVEKILEIFGGPIPSIIGSVFARPKMYTMSGTLPEAFVFLEGYYSAKARYSHQKHGKSWTWVAYLEWMAEHFDCGPDWREICERVVQKHSGNDAMYDELLRLYLQFEEESEFEQIQDLCADLVIDKNNIFMKELMKLGAGEWLDVEVTCKNFDVLTPESRAKLSDVFAFWQNLPGENHGTGMYILVYFYHEIHFAVQTALFNRESLLSLD